MYLLSQGGIIKPNKLRKRGTANLLWAFLYTVKLLLGFRKFKADNAKQHEYKPIFFR